MSVRREYTVWCDVDGCPQWGGSYANSPREARENAAREGWTRPLATAKDGTRKRFDVCPQCSPENL